VLAAAVLTGCGYSTHSSLDPKYRTIAVPAFQNESHEYDFQAALTNAVIRKFVADGRLEVVPATSETPADADIVVEGAILDYKLQGQAYDKNDDVTQFLSRVTVAVRVRDVDSGKILWEEPKLTNETLFYTRASGPSSDRLRGNAEAFLPSVRSFASVEENRGASEALEQIASEIVYRTIEPW
jgi:TolB-like protein